MVTQQQQQQFRVEIAQAALHGTPLRISYQLNGKVADREILPFAFGRAHNGNEIIVCWKYDGTHEIRSYDLAAITAIHPGVAPMPDEPVPAAPRLQRLYAFLDTIS